MTGIRLSTTIFLSAGDARTLAMAATGQYTGMGKQEKGSRMNTLERVMNYDHKVILKAGDHFAR